MIRQLSLFEHLEKQRDHADMKIRKDAYISRLRSGLDWRDKVWNPVTGCDRISPACDNCYAMRIAARMKHDGSAKYQRDGDRRTSGPGFGLTTHSYAIDTPRKWKRGQMVFMGSMTDIFHKEVHVKFLERLFRVIWETPQHTYQVLTKRSTRIKQLAQVLDWPPNLWLGVTVEMQRFQYRIDHLCMVPTVIKFVGAMPILGEMQIDLSEIDYVIASGESGENARVTDPLWQDQLNQACESYDVPLIY